MESKILPVEQIIGQIIDDNMSAFVWKSPTQSVSYSWGDQQELNAWIIVKDKEIAGMRTFGGGVNKTKYPLIFMVTPIDGKLLLRENLFEKITFIICCDTKAEWLNSTREKETMPMLTDIANTFLEILSQNKNTQIIRRNGQLDVTFRKVYNYSTNGKESEAVDIWDAIKLTFDLKINVNCLKNLQKCL